VSVGLYQLIDPEFLRRRSSAVALAVLVLGLAMVEAANAWMAPTRAPTDRDWRAAAARVRAEFRPGDLIVAAPAWADPLMRHELGDLVPIAVAGRMDAADFGRVWEIAQRGARAPETAGGRVVQSSRHGALSLRLWEKPKSRVVFDFLAGWRTASLSVRRAGGETPCWLGQDRFQCGDGTGLGPELLEVDTTSRNGLGVEPQERATTALEYESVPLGHELTVAAGLHSVWLRKAGDGKVEVRVLIDGRAVGSLQASSASGWSLRRFDTTAWAGRSGRVRFEITTDKAYARHLGFNAEAREP